MVRDAVRGYWALASGLTDVTRQRATAAARALVAQGEATAEQVTAIAEDLISTSVTNRTALVGVVRHEIERARTAMGMPTVADMEALTRRVAALEAELGRLRAPAATAPSKKAPATKAPGKRAPAKQAPAKQAPAKQAPAKKAPATRAPAKKTGSATGSAPA